MKKLLQLRKMLLLCALIVGGGSVWGQATQGTILWAETWTGATTATGGSDSATPSANYGKGTTVYNSGTVTYTQSANTVYVRNEELAGGSKPELMLTSGKTWTISNIPTGGASELTLTYKSNNTKSSVTCSTSGASISGSSKSYTITTGGAETITLVFDCSGNTRIDDVSLTVKTAGGTTPAYTITAQSNNTDYGTVSLSGSVITGAPKSGYRYADPAYAVSPANSATVSQNENAFTVTPSANTTVTINFEAIPTHTATFSVNGSTTTQQVSEGTAISFPDNPSDINEKTFMGWTKTAIDGTTDDPDEIGFVDKASETMGTSDVTYYAVFAEVDDYGSGSYTLDYNNESGLSSSTEWGTSYGKSYDYTASDGSTWTVKAYKSNGMQINTGRDCSIGVPYCSGYITTISITCSAAKAVGFSESNYEGGGTINYLAEGTDATSQTLDLTGKYVNDGFIVPKGGSTSITKIVVNYHDVYYYEYCTTVPEVAVAKPVITVAENPFLFSTTVTITCATEGATIKYSFDNLDWNDYSSALTITDSHNIWAKAVKGSEESSIAQAYAEKILAEPTVTVSGDLTLDLEGETNVNAGTLTAAVTYNDEAVAGATVAWSSSNTDIATIDESTGVVTIKATGEVTFTATYEENDDYTEATGTKTVTIIDSNIPGTTAKNPYTVAQAKDAIDNSGNVTGVFVTGIVSQVDAVNTNSYATYWISDDGSTTNQFEIYQGKYLNGANFTSENQIQVGDVVIVSGNITLYQSSIYEFSAGSQLVSLTRKPAATITVTNGTEQTVDRTQDEEELTLTATANSGATVVFTLDNENTTLTEGTDFDFEDGEFAFYTKKGGVIVVKANAPAAGDYKAAEEVTITINVIGEKENPTIAVNPTETVVFGSTFTVDDTMIEGGAITVSSSNTDVATVSGLVITPVAVGTTTITVATAENEDYKAGSETFTLTVTAPVASTTAPTSEVVLFNEGFSKTSNSGGRDGLYSGSVSSTILNSSNSTHTDESWTTIEKAYANNYCSKIGTTSASGSLTTASISFGDATSGTLKFSAAGWVNSNKTFTGSVSITNANFKEDDYTFTGYEFEPTQGQFDDFEVEIVDITGDVTLTFSGYCYFLDDVKVTKAGSALTTTVTLNKYGYATYCSPYPIDFSSTTGYTAWRVSEISGNTITFAQITEKIKGGQGVLLYNKDADGENTSEATINFADGTTEFSASENLFEGTLAPTYVEANEYYGLSGTSFVPVGEGKVPANKALLPVSAISSNARTLTFVFEDATGISTIEHSPLNFDDAVYNLQGQRVVSPKNGLYIVNGKKVVLK